MSDSARDLMTRGIAAAKAGEPAQARKYLEWSLRQGPNTRQQVDAHYWLAKMSQDEKDKQKHLEVVLQLEPTHFLARRDMAVIRGLLTEAELVEPVRPGQTTVQAKAEGKRFTCPQCGSRVTYEAALGRLVCQHCGYQGPLPRSSEARGGVPEKDFIDALASARGHTRPSPTTIVSCHGCGADFILPSRLVSEVCPYCRSTYVLDQSREARLVPPAGLIPFQVGQGEAAKLLREYLDTHGIRRTDRELAPEGIFAPAWTFDISGELAYRYLEGEGDQWLPRKGSQIVLADDLPVPASHNLPLGAIQSMREFEFEGMIEYDPSLLAGWPAQTYEITATDAAMDARFQILEEAKAQARSNLFGRVRDFQPQSPDLLVAAYRLVLLPFWLTSYAIQDQTYLATINGQTGAVNAQRPQRRWWAWLSGLLGGRS